MSKKHFIALADMIRDENRRAKQYGDGQPVFLPVHLDCLADFCKQQNIDFNRDRWLSYIAGECGPNGGKL